MTARTHKSSASSVFTCNSALDQKREKQWSRYMDTVTEEWGISNESTVRTMARRKMRAKMQEQRKRRKELSKDPEYRFKRIMSKVHGGSAPKAPTGSSSRNKLQQATKSSSRRSRSRSRSKKPAWARTRQAVPLSSTQIHDTLPFPKSDPGSVVFPPIDAKRGASQSR